MKILVVGGSGQIGSLVLPLLAQQHSLRVFDLKPPLNPAWEYVAGDVRDLTSILQAMIGVDALIYMAMGLKELSHNPIADQIQSNFDVNAKGLYHALLAAHQAKVQSIIYASTLSIYGNLEDIERSFYYREDLPPTARDVYGLTKFLGEEVCRHAARNWQLDINVLRLCAPRSIEDWQDQVYRGTPSIKTSADDLVRALLAALEFRRGYQVFDLSGDYTQQIVNMAKARHDLHWRPLARPIKIQREKIGRRWLKRSAQRWLGYFKNICRLP